MRRWLLISFGVLMAAIAASLVVWWKEPLNWKEPWNKDSIYWLTDVRGYVITQERERTLKRKDTFKECKACPEMVVVPAGEFMMGWPETQKRYSDNEGPQHKVMISRPYAVARFELTFAEWDACADHGDCPRDIAASGSSRPRLPVINVSWDDAQRYVAWLSKITGKPYRLLSEAEWEYAARAGATTRYSFGDDEAMLDQYAWYSGNSINRVHPVGLKTPNAFGVFDMHGNVWEWVADCYHDDYEGAPVDGAAWTTGGCATRVLRGGAWNNSPGLLRAAYRLRDHHRRSAIFFRLPGRPHTQA
jgi:formylglycine-generating enzyme required for sulfatase activity